MLLNLSDKPQHFARESWSEGTQRSPHVKMTLESHSNIGTFRECKFLHMESTQLITHHQINNSQLINLQIPFTDMMNNSSQFTYVRAQHLIETAAV